MKNRVEIGKRIKRLRLENDFSQTHIAKILFISQAAYSLIENSQNGIVSEHIIKLSRLYGVSTDYILTGDKSIIRIGRDTGFVPMLRTSNHRHLLAAIEDDSIIDIKDWFKLPDFDPSKDQTLFKMETEGMAPVIFPGDVLICHLQSNLDKVLDGSAVVVITVQGILVKRLKNAKNADYFLFENDNETFGLPERIMKKDIKKLLMIRGKINHVLISGQNTAEKSKMQKLEESIEVLKKELFEMNRKLASLTGSNNS
ncbi:helix-turn-helix domain-containing protein [Gramella sp. GC03-9]|uniref:Helix-turn-helix domain-containing protein n=1 Tax=Christiangramia oceanisediminis TaxID=2920386 RepID=A0A9X2RA76_9FLAO|nr:helix-turn-helix domain-containing protein [Gramella oceanisediminis]MCP9201203.1 helix-turn-helix domain-containing protein [Gramella oceanisediminis]